MKRIIKTGILLLALGFLQSCYWDNEEELYPMAQPCDTTNVTYSGSIAPLLDANCASCHNSSLPQGSVNLDNYGGVKVVADNGRLWGAVNHSDGYSAMPQNRPKLNDCNLSKIRIWINDGALDN